MPLENTDLCFEYRKLGHFKVDCLMLKTKKKKKSMMVTWNESESSVDGKKKKKDNICLMVKTSKIYNSDSSFSQEDFDELMNVIDSLKRKLKIKQIKNQTLRKSIKMYEDKENYQATIIDRLFIKK